MSVRGKLQIVERTDVGQVRDHNEDFIGSDLSRGIAILADGMGGLNAGEVASSMSVHVVMNELVEFVDGTSTLQSAHNNKKSDQGDQQDLASQVVKITLEKANSAVFHVSQTQPQCRGMGTTIVTTLFYDNKITVAHIGDSRLYRLRDDKLAQITKDHSFVQELIDKGLYTPEEARLSAQKNVVTRAVGIAPTVDVEINAFKALQGDLYLMCSDGLTDLVIDEDILKIMRLFGTDLEGMAEQLVAIANASGGKDNISVILIRILKPFPADANLIERIVDWFE